MNAIEFKTKSEKLCQAMLFGDNETKYKATGIAIDFFKALPSTILEDRSIALDVAAFQKTIERTMVQLFTRN